MSPSVFFQIYFSIALVTWFGFFFFCTSRDRNIDEPFWVALGFGILWLVVAMFILIMMIREFFVAVVFKKTRNR